MLELARQSHADAVLVRDPALLLLRAEYPEIEFHFSTQTCMTNSADVAAAGKLGANRVVLAREMTLAEIAAASAVPGVETEVFVQGALCFSVSGRCLLSSWAGGRSGNRGTCTSPCRVPGGKRGQGEKGTGPICAKHRDRSKIGRAVPANWTCPLFSGRSKRHAVFDERSFRDRSPAGTSPGRRCRDKNRRPAEKRRLGRPGCGAVQACLGGRRNR